MSASTVVRQRQLQRRSQSQRDALQTGPSTRWSIRRRSPTSRLALTCQPPGVPRIGPPDKIIQSKDVVAFLYDDPNGAFWRIVPTDGTPHRDLEPSYLGDSIGWWEGDTLVVETIHLNTETWLTDDGAFHTENLRVIERLSREGDTLHFRAIAHDPDVLAAPWELRPRELPLSDWELEEPVPCVERSLGLMEDRTLHHDNAR